MIFISPGHHQSSKGASYGDFTEFDEAVLWQIKLMDLLTRERAIAVPPGRLRDKVDFINLKMTEFPGPHVAIEIHFNMVWIDFNEDGKVDPNEYVGDGSETLYYPQSDYGKELATRIQERLSMVFPPNRGAKEGWYQMNPKNKPDYFLAKTNCPALIIEPEFVHHKDKIIEARDVACHVISQELLSIVGAS